MILLFQAVSDEGSSMRKYGRLCARLRDKTALKDNGEEVTLEKILASYCCNTLKNINLLEGVDLHKIEKVRLINYSLD